MYNSDIPSRAELPTSRQLLRSTLIAIVAALAILITIVLPAEYNIDPTGVGRVLGLAQMGEIKVQLAEEAERDRQMDQNSTVLAPGSSLFGRVFAALVVSPASAQTASRQDVTTLTLTPGQGAEIKLVMKAGAKADYSWTVAGGVVNFDTHGDGGGKSISYEKGRAVPGDDGVLEAAFDGNHGWFWRNRGSADVTLTLKTSGAYAEIKRTD
ncbi:MULTISPECIES: transmembrane anchor protein [Ancylobacter]|uniref:Transmembrane anchor protein n=1 Tax=Ancylobacter pratisalsi TaxID=1745854 RepID=A0A6P1YSL2_9HYPH|nr:transmembrane anchor protein [Ancylobacter pratisalsi]QIB36497.1 transmembrane anchor protein [Ancylobacter pratisalsi]